MPGPKRACESKVIDVGRREEARMLRCALGLLGPLVHCKKGAKGLIDLVQDRDGLRVSVKFMQLEISRCHSILCRDHLSNRPKNADG